ncbi:hypothetical protein PIB30_075426 [Stylosanthes scabra]|uniref:Uncharacterized protein n=1 Tax=Stylosanthes scabra TaxID=79078 RepID=A0ABU6ZNP6_9FABA|nr:hypothetical protein [Stylosanthes scabra]
MEVISGKIPWTVMTVSLLRAYVTDWWFLNHIDNIALTDTTGKPYPVKRVSDNVGLQAVNRRMSSWFALGSGMHHTCLPHFCECLFVNMICLFVSYLSVLWTIDLRRSSSTSHKITRGPRQNRAPPPQSSKLKELATHDGEWLQEMKQGGLTPRLQAPRLGVSHSAKRAGLQHFWVLPRLNLDSGCWRKLGHA